MGRFSSLFFILLLLVGSGAQAASSNSTGFGISAGSGIPFVGQGGVHYRYSDTFTFYGGYNMLSLSSGSASVDLTMPELLVQYHPFAGSFFLGVGVGQESLDVKSTDVTTGLEARAEVTAMTGIAKVGWMWGASNGGFWFGIDLSYIMPMNSDTTITAPGVPTTDPAYRDVQDAADRFGESSYINFTFARLGYIF